MFVCVFVFVFVCVCEVVSNYYHRKGKRKTVDNFFEFGVECRNKVELQKFPDNFIKIFLFSNLSSKLVMLCV